MDTHIRLDDDVEVVHKIAVAEDIVDGCLHKNNNDMVVELVELVELLDAEVDSDIVLELVLIVVEGVDEQYLKFGRLVEEHFHCHSLLCWFLFLFL